MASPRASRRWAPDTAGLLALTLKCGEIGLQVLALLNGAHTGSFGVPQPTPVLMGHRPGKAILVSGHDLQALLEQTAGTGSDIYTHGEMLPVHGYPELNRYPHRDSRPPRLIAGIWSASRTAPCCRSPIG